MEDILQSYILQDGQQRLEKLANAFLILNQI